MSKTTDATDVVELAGLSVRQAAKQYGISPAAIYAERKARQLKAAGICHCCGQAFGAAQAEREAVMRDLQLTAEALEPGTPKRVLIGNILKYLEHR